MKDWRWFDNFKKDLEDQAARDVARHGRQPSGKKTTDFDDSASITRHRGKGQKQDRSTGGKHPGAGGKSEANQWRETEWQQARYDYLRQNSAYLNPWEHAELQRFQQEARTEEDRRMRGEAMRQAAEARRAEGRRFARELRREQRRQAREDARDERREGMRQAEDELRRGDPPPGYKHW